MKKTGLCLGFFRSNHPGSPLGRTLGLFRTGLSLRLRCLRPRLRGSAMGMSLPRSFPLLLSIAIVLAFSSHLASLVYSAYCDIDVSLGRKWLLKGDSFTPHDRHLGVTVDFPEGVGMPEAVANYQVVETGLQGSLTRTRLTRWEGQADVSNLIPGVFHLLVTVADTVTECRSDSVTFYVSYPFYHVWSIDWEGTYVPRVPYLENMGALADSHLIPISQLFNPRIYVQPGMPEWQRAEMTQWVLERQTARGDEIGLHLHMYFDFVDSAGLTPITTPQCGTRTDGYDVPFANYNYDESLVLLNFAIGLFLGRGLSMPCSFRAGAWLADEENLAALSVLGFLDSSGSTPKKISLCDSPWDIEVTSQPYHPCGLDQNTADCEPGDSNLVLLEIPNNIGYTSGSWAPTANFDANYSGAPLDSIRVGVLLSHAPSVFLQESLAIERYFAHADSLLYRNDRGAVRYVRLVDVRTAIANSTPWPPESLGPESLVSGQSIQETRPTFVFRLRDPDSLNILKCRLLISNSSQYSDTVLDYESGLCPQGIVSFIVGQPESLGHYYSGCEGQELSTGAYYWKVEAIDSRGARSEWTTANSGDIAFFLTNNSWVGGDAGGSVPLSISFTNPSRSGVLMRVGAPLRDGAKVRIFACSGRRLRELSCEAGGSSIYWDGKDSEGRPVPSGVYFVELRLRDETAVKKLVLVR